jgi:hypothetical protein
VGHHTPNTANMDVDAHPASGDSGKTTAPSVGAKVALTSFNHSPITLRGKEIVDSARKSLPHLFASRSASGGVWSTSPSCVHTFMQGQTQPEPVLFEVSHSPRERSIETSTSTQEAASLSQAQVAAAPSATLADAFSSLTQAPAPSSLPKPTA